MVTPAPIAFFAYKRPEHTRRALTALRHCEGAMSSELYLFCDGPRSKAEVPLVAEVRAIAASQPWCGRVEVIAQPQNRGLARSLIAGITRLCQSHGRVIVIEDDLILAPQCLTYLNAALEQYALAETVMQVSGYMFPMQRATMAACFLPLTTSWGWATWARAWDPFSRHQTADANWDAVTEQDFQRLQHNSALRHQFNLAGAYDYFGMLQAQRAGQLDAWDIRWYLHVFLRRGLVLFPGRSLVQNLGFDGSGTHCGTLSQFHTSLDSDELPSLPTELTIDQTCLQQVRDFLKQRRPGVWQRCLRFLKKLNPGGMA